MLFNLNFILKHSAFLFTTKKYLLLIGVLCVLCCAGRMGALVCARVRPLSSVLYRPAVSRKSAALQNLTGEMCQA
jgi:hypothetical protein